jgi:hypothetical protein
VGHVR